MENNSENHSSIEIENSLLGILLSSEKSIFKVKGLLMPEDFYSKYNKIIYEAMINLTNSGFVIEVSPLVDELKKNSRLEKAGGMDYISSLVSQAGLEANITKYIKTIAEKSQLRKVNIILSELYKESSKPSVNSGELLEKIEQKILSVTRDTQTKEFQSASEVIEKTIKGIEARTQLQGVSGIASGLPSLDKITSGFQKGDLIILAARPSMGKTALALNLAANASKNYNVAFFSLEMPSKQLFERILSFTSYVDGYKITNSSLLTNSDFNKIYSAAKNINKMKIFTDDSPGLKLSELVWKARRLSKNKMLDMIVIDYLQLLTVGSKSSNLNRQNEVALISRTLKQLARELEVPVIALSQLSRDVEKRENKKPMMSDLRESGAIEQDADIIAFLYRESYYNSAKEKVDTTHQTSNLIISKHRNGALGQVDLTFNPKIGIFTDIEKDTNKVEGDSF